MSRCSRKVWRFLWPPRVEIEWYFEDPRSAGRVHGCYRRVGLRARIAWRRVEGRRIPAVIADWKCFQELRALLGMPGEPIDLVAERFIQQKLRKALEELARDIAMLTAAGIINP